VAPIDCKVATKPPAATPPPAATAALDIIVAAVLPAAIPLPVKPSIPTTAGIPMIVEPPRSDASKIIPIMVLRTEYMSDYFLPWLCFDCFSSQRK
jgi:hypothetical protein